MCRSHRSNPHSSPPVCVSTLVQQTPPSRSPHPSHLSPSPSSRFPCSYTHTLTHTLYPRLHLGIGLLRINFIDSHGTSTNTHTHTHTHTHVHVHILTSFVVDVPQLLWFDHGHPHPMRNSSQCHSNTPILEYIEPIGPCSNHRSSFLFYRCLFPTVTSGAPYFFLVPHGTLFFFLKKTVC
jgi:hypothetical protein